MSKYIYHFKHYENLKTQLGSTEKVSALIGAKATRLNEMKLAGINVPHGFMITTNTYHKFAEQGGKELPEEIWDNILKDLKKLEAQTGEHFGGTDKPLLLAVRGDSQYSMYGMLDSVQYLGINDLTARKISTNRCFVFDSYRRLLEHYGTVVLNISTGEFEELLENIRISRNRNSTADFAALDWIEVTKSYKALIMRKSGRPFPQNPYEQLKNVVTAIFKSYTSPRAKLYRDHNKIPHNIGESILVLPMAFSNNGSKSCACVVNSRNPFDGTSKLNGEFCINSTCEDVCNKACDSKDINELQNSYPEVFSEIKGYVEKIEKLFSGPQTIEFVVDNGNVYVTVASETQFANIGRFKAYKELGEGEIIPKNSAILATRPEDLQQLMAPELKEPATPFCKGIPAGHETVTGKIVLSTEECIQKANAGESVVLVRVSLSPYDYQAIVAAKAVITVKGTNLTRSTVLLRQLMRTACIGCADLKIDFDNKAIICNDVTIQEGEEVTVCGDGSVIQGAQELGPVKPLDNQDALTLLKWADDARKGKFEVLAKTANFSEVASAYESGADGLAAFPIESIFDEKRDLIANIYSNREDSLKEIESAIQSTATEIFKIAKSQSAAFRLFAPSFSEYMPCLMALAEQIGQLRAKKEFAGDAEVEDELEAKKKLMETIKTTKESNPIFGLAGTRLALVQQDFLEAQVRGVLNGAKAARDAGADPHIRFLLPNVTVAGEVTEFIKRLEVLSTEIGEKAEVGAEIKAPRPCLASKGILDAGAFILVDSAALNESIFGMCQKDAEKTFIQKYYDNKIFTQNPFTYYDPTTNEKLVKLCVKGARTADPDKFISVSGEVFNDPKRVLEYYGYGVNSITCTDSLVPVTRITAAHAVISNSH